jgi:hypothetical protein
MGCHKPSPGIKDEISTTHVCQLVQYLPSFLGLVSLDRALVRRFEADARACSFHAAATNVVSSAIETSYAAQFTL